MLNLVFKHEIKKYLSSGLFKILTLFFWGLSLITMSSAWTQYTQHTQTQQEVTHHQMQLWQSQGKLNAHTAAHHGLYAFKPWHSLSIVEPGFNPVLSKQIFLEAHRRNIDDPPPFQIQSSWSYFAPLTASSLLHMLLPLFLIVLGYDTVQRERKTGTLKILLIQGVSPFNLGLGKLLALFSCALLWAAPVIVGSAFWLNSWDHALRWAVLHLLNMSYLFIVCAITVALSSLFQNAGVLLFSLLAFWACNTFLAPRTALSAQSLRHPLPTRNSFEETIHQEIQTLPDWQTRTDTIKAQLLKEQKSKGLKGLSVNLEGEVLKASEKDESQVFARHFLKFQAHLRQQEQSLGHWGWVFPILAVQNLSRAMAASDLSHHELFLDAAEHYRYQWVQMLNESIAQHPEREAFDYKAGEELWRKTEPFEFQWPQADDVLQQEKHTLVILLAWLLGCIGITGLSFRKMKVLER